MYNVNWNRLIKQLIWGSIRKPVMVAFLEALITPVKRVDTLFGLFRSDVQERMRITPQKRILQYWLNYKFDPFLQRIEIKDYDQLDTVFIFLEAENQPLYLPTFISASNYDFEVCIPAILQSQEVYIRSFLDAYKLATKRYIITWV